MGTFGQSDRDQAPPERTPAERAPAERAPGRSLLQWVFRSGDGRLRAGWRVTLLLAGLILIYVVSATILWVVLAWWFGPAGAEAGSLVATLNRRLPYWPLLVDVVAAPGICGLLWCFRRYLDRRSWRSLGFRWEAGAVWEVVSGLLLGVWVIGLSVAPLALSGAARVAGEAGSTAEARGAGHLSAVLGVLVLAAFLEELVARGYILGNIAEALGAVPAVLISGAVFAGLHLANPHAGALGVANIFLAGVLLGTVFVITRRLWAPWALHLAWNATLGLVLGIPVSGVRLPSLLRLRLVGSRLLTGGDFGLEASLWNTLALTVTIAATLRLGWRLFGGRAAETAYRAAR